MTRVARFGRALALVVSAASVAGTAFAQDARDPITGSEPLTGEALLDGARLRLGGRGRIRYEGFRQTDHTDLFDSRSLTAPEKRVATAQFRVWGELETAAGFGALVEVQHFGDWTNDHLWRDQEERVDLRRAWVRWRVPVVSGLELSLGRFAVPEFGDGRIFSADDFSDIGRVWDGASARWVTGPVDWTAFVVNVNDDDPIPDWPGKNRDHWMALLATEVRAWPWLDVDLYHVERWFDRQFASEDPTVRSRGPRIDVTSGVRLALHAGRAHLILEGYSQLGRQGPDPILAGATVERLEVEIFSGAPVFRGFFEHAFASGDHRPLDGERNTFDPLFPDTHRHLGPYDALGYRNVNALAMGFSAGVGDWYPPLADWRFHFVARGSFLHSQHDAWYGADGEPILIDPTGHTASSRTLEGELSGWLEGSLAGGQVHLSFGFAHWCPNNLLGDLGFNLHGYRVWVQTTVEF